MADDKDTVQDLMEESEGGDWLTTYADLVTLLLTFFVMLFAMSTTNLQKFQEIIASIQKGLGAPTAVIEMVAPSIGAEPFDLETEKPPDIPPLPPESIEVDWRLLTDIKSLAEKYRYGEHLVIYEEKSRVTIRVEGQVLFGSGEARLNPEAVPILDDIAAIIRNYPGYRVNIKGHTDDVPIATALFPSNWELSAIRATTVLRYLVDRDIDPRRLTATGYGEVLPLAPNDTPDHRAMNRRVEFVLEKEDD